jgi:hypothetical protein
MVKPPTVWGILPFRDEGRPDQKKRKENGDHQVKQKTGSYGSISDYGGG